MAADSMIGESGVTPGEVGAELTRLLSSRHFVRANRLSRLLSYVVEQALREAPRSVTESKIAAEVFDRTDTFDASIESVVRVEANRLRARLRQYYQGEGRLDPVVIQLKPGSYQPSVRRRPAPRPGHPSPARSAAIAVLPFHNADGDPGQEFLCEGIPEELTYALTKAESLRVIAWTLTRRLIGSAHDIRALAGRLKVNALVEGSIRRAGNRLRIAAQLIDASDCCCLWSDAVESDLHNLPAIREHIAHSVIDALQAGRSARLRGPAVQGEDPELFRAYLKGRYHLNRRTAHGLHRAIEYFERMAEAAPGHGRALAGQAEALALLAWYCHARPDDVMPKAKSLALRALKSDPRLPDAHRALGLVHQLYEWDWHGARMRFQLAVDLNPGAAVSLFEYGYFLGRMGELDEALATMRRALELDPLSPNVNTNLGATYYYRRDYAAALRQLQEVVEVDPDYWPAHYRLAEVYLQQGAFESALASLERGTSVTEPRPIIRAIKGFTLARLGHPDAAHGVRKSLVAAGETGWVSPVLMAIQWLGLGDTGRAMDWLERGIRERDALVVDLKIDPLYDPLRQLARFRRLLAGMKLKL